MQLNTEPQITELNYYVFIFASPVGAAFSFFLIYTYIKIKQCRTQPGDLFLGVSISDFILCVHWFLSALVSPFGIWKEPIQSEGTFCQINAFFSTSAGQLEFLYNSCFCIYMFMILKNALFQSRVLKKSFHVMAIGIWAVMMIYYVLKD